MIRKKEEMAISIIQNCHDGRGSLECRQVLNEKDSGIGIVFMHDDMLEPGAIIGEHPHKDSEEIYFVVEGSGIMIMDGKKSPINTGDVSLVNVGHSHGIINGDDGIMRLLVIAGKE